MDLLNIIFAPKTPKKTEGDKIYESLSEMDEREILIDQTMIFYDMQRRLHSIEEDTARIKRNIVFFFWACFGWIVALLIFGGFAAIAGLMLGS